ncbi:MAG: GlsB/YeaQ/YmgE family stress response membrane protein [Actinomycetota bacterium]|nr:GlsB/YeaQ/YmgE family stress response membrane protein [Actinomycetota bacterium]
MISFILGLLVIGLIAGALARFLVPGRDPMSIGATIALGIVGSFVGGFLGDILFRSEAQDRGLGNPAGLIGSVIGAIIVLLIYNAVTNRRRARA